ncbi:expressed unknown protein [Seminavis robusta]|uniref:Uncharacterized protein n=1 Tax=Seminavis robusta TaxID=568900 RepID=A0A9N8DGJ0_9STRA|nr:expressed unknown protein [Seminavis robusta]|eukprot:Sro134_g063270.1 n/a (400) ;mRNA; f:4353-5552
MRKICGAIVLAAFWAMACVKYDVTFAQWISGTYYMDTAKSQTGRKTHLVDFQTRAQMQASNSTGFHRRDCHTECQYMFAERMGYATMVTHSIGDWDTCRCGKIFCQGNITENHSSEEDVLSSCSWSPAAINTLVELVQREDICTPSHVQDFYLPEEWEKYQFGDFFREQAQWRGDDWHTQHRKEDSFIEAYYQKAIKSGTRGNNYDLLHQVVKEKLRNMTKAVNGPNKDVLPKPRTMVVHLRIGDVVDLDPHTVQELLETQRYFYRFNKGGICCAMPWQQPDWDPIEEDFNAYVRPLSYYKEALLTNQSTSFDHVVLMGAVHKGQVGVRAYYATKSCIYTTTIQRYIQKVWPQAEVTLRLAQHPDEDLVFASHSKKLVTSGGGYSKIISRLQEKVMEET